MQNIAKTRAGQTPTLQALLDALVHEEPKSIYLALHNPYWREVAEEEYSTLQINNTWSTIELPPNRIPIGCK